MVTDLKSANPRLAWYLMEIDVDYAALWSPKAALFTAEEERMADE